MREARSPQTIAAANGVGDDGGFGAIAPPVYLSTSYAFPGFERPGRYDYSRAGNPTRDMLAETLAKLEGGAGATVVCSGMAAIDLVLARREPGDLVLAPHDCYGGTYKLLSLRAAKRQFDLLFVDQNDTAAMAAAMQRKPSLVLIETPSNPLLRIVDIHRVASLAKAIGAEVAVDNTFMSPALQQPIALGADFVIHSTTKYLNGHSDVLGGAVIAASKQDATDLASWANATGVIGSPFDAFLTLRGLRTLFPRIEQQQRSAAVLAGFLERHQRVAKVYYPGLASHPGHELAKTQQKGFGAMLSFEVAGGRDSVRRFVEALRVITLADSLGGVESLIAHPATMTHTTMERRAGAPPASAMTSSDCRWAWKAKPTFSATWRKLSKRHAPSPGRSMNKDQKIPQR
jgi:cystathionine gamma-synthase